MPTTGLRQLIGPRPASSWLAGLRPASSWRIASERSFSADERRLFRGIHISRGHRVRGVQREIRETKFVRFFSEGASQGLIRELVRELVCRLIRELIREPARKLIREPARAPHYRPMRRRHGWREEPTEAFSRH